MHNAVRRTLYNVVWLTWVSVRHLFCSPAGTRGICCGAEPWTRAEGGWASGWRVAGFQGPSAYSCAWPAVSLEGSWCSLLRESAEACGQNASVWGKEGESDVPYPEVRGRGRSEGPRSAGPNAGEGNRRGAPGPGDSGTSAGCSASAIWGSGRAGDGPTDWGLTAPLGCSLYPTRTWATEWTSPAWILWTHSMRDGGLYQPE